MLLAALFSKIKFVYKLIDGNTAVSFNILRTAVQKEIPPSYELQAKIQCQSTSFFNMISVRRMIGKEAAL